MKLTQVKGNTWVLEGFELIPLYRLDNNKCILLVAFSDFFASLEAQNVIQEGSSGAELDADAIRTYLLGIAEEAGDTEEIARIKALTDEALRKEDTGSHVFLYLYGHVLDAMEDFHITLEAQ